MLLQRLGYWGDGNGGLPQPSTLVDESWDEVERDLVAEHLVRGFVARAYMGQATCGICREQVGALELTDGIYVWPEGFAHYLIVHHVRPPDLFVNHVRSFAHAIESADVADSWWRSLAD